MTKIIDKIMFDFKVMTSMSKESERFSKEWEIMDDSLRSIYTSKGEYIEVSLRALVQGYFVNLEIESEMLGFVK